MSPRKGPYGEANHNSGDKSSTTNEVQTLRYTKIRAVRSIDEATRFELDKIGVSFVKGQILQIVRRPVENNHSGFIGNFNRVTSKKSLIDDRYPDLCKSRNNHATNKGKEDEKKKEFFWFFRSQ